jgi:hypothetical protein
MYAIGVAYIERQATRSCMPTKIIRSNLKQQMSRSDSPEKKLLSTSTVKSTCSMCFSHLTLCRCSPYKIAAHRLQTKEVPELEHCLRESAAQIEVLTEQLEFANHKYDDVTRPLIAKVEALTADINLLNMHMKEQIAQRDEMILALQHSLEVRRTEQQRTNENIAELQKSNRTLKSNIQKLGKCDIIQASKNGDIDLVKLWLSLECDVNKRDHECALLILSFLQSQ